MKIYQIDSSARKKGSTSRALAKKLLDKIKKPEDEVIYRDLNDEMVFVTGLTESGMNIEEKDQNENHKKMFELSNQLVKELKESDIIIISTFSIPKKLRINFNQGVKKSSELFNFVPPEVITRYACLFFNNPSLLPFGLNLKVSPIRAAKSDQALRVAGGP